MERRGRHKVFLGMAAGVGKTYRMLQEGQAEAEAGRDVVIGYLEPHDRPETAAQADGLEVVPRRWIEHGDRTMEEMDYRRRPELALIDELAHTNVPGSEHGKRYEDVEEVLAAGIDVFSTVNVQHLESLNDSVAELTGTRVREVVPDAIVGSADEVVLVDLTVEALLVRLVRKYFDLTPKGIIDSLDLRRPIYRATSYHGHFGREDAGFPWENTDKADALARGAA